MRIQHSDHDTDRLGVGGEEFESIGDGVFEVPEEVAAQLLGFPHWSQYFGETPAPRSRRSKSEKPEDQAGSGSEREPAPRSRRSA